VERSKRRGERMPRQSLAGPARRAAYSARAAGPAAPPRRLRSVRGSDCAVLARPTAAALSWDMTAPASPPPVVETSAGDFPLCECRLHVGGRDWSVLHTGAVLTHDDEARYFADLAGKLPYGVVLWPAAIALAHEIATRADAFRGRSVLELGAGTGLPGVVAASLGARVVESDRQEGALAVCRLNGGRNGVANIEYRSDDWTAWTDERRYDWLIGSDILYAEAMHPHLRRIFEANLAPGGRVLIADPFRPPSLALLEALERDGWRVTMTKWTVGKDATPRPIGVFELTPG
jgi:methyltransferase-like protein 23